LRCERGFRFLKDPLFFASSTFVKNEKRIETMGVLMGLCLLVYNLGQRMLRKELVASGKKVKKPDGKLTDKPTLKIIFQKFQGVHLVQLSEKIFVSNLNDELLTILKYFTVYCQNYYQ
jgi:transposase